MHATLNSVGDADATAEDADVARVLANVTSADACARIAASFVSHAGRGRATTGGSACRAPGQARPARRCCTSCSARTPRGLPAPTPPSARHRGLERRGEVDEACCATGVQGPAASPRMCPDDPPPGARSAERGRAVLSGDARVRAQRAVRQRAAVRPARRQRAAHRAVALHGVRAGHGAAEPRRALRVQKPGQGYRHRVPVVPAGPVGRLHVFELRRVRAHGRRHGGGRRRGRAPARRAGARRVRQHRRHAPRGPVPGPGGRAPPSRPSASRGCSTPKRTRARSCRRTARCWPRRSRSSRATGSTTSRCSRALPQAAVFDAAPVRLGSV